MIGYLKGKVINVSENVVILDVNGIGYELTVSASCLNMLSLNNQGEVYTYLAVNEQGISLYGFLNLEEKNMFLKLINVQGVGPKMGITILSSISISDLALAIATNDVKTLSKVKGCGKKTAERIILELREKIEQVAREQTNAEVTEVVNSKDEEDALLALMSLGFTKGESIKAIKKAVENGAVGLQSIISVAIKYAGKN